jgi:chromosome partitioning protein
MRKVFAVASQKGGVAKTTTTFNLAVALTKLGKKVLVIDLDPQGSLTICVGVENPDSLEHSASTLLEAALDMDEEGSLESSRYVTQCAEVDIIPSNIELAAFEAYGANVMGGDKALRTAIAPLLQSYDIILIDCAPSLGKLTINALAASDGVIIPVTPHLLSVVGLKQLVATIRKVKTHVNPTVRIDGILMTRCDINLNLYKDIKELLLELYGGKIRIFNTLIHNSTRVGEAERRRQSVIAYSKNSKPAKAYKALAKELIDGD